MGLVTFGDLIALAERDIGFAEQYRSPITARSGEVARQLQRLSLAVARYLDDPMKHATLVAVSAPGTEPGDQALLELRQALMFAADSFQPLIPDETAANLRDPCVSRLARAADALAAGRDLLSTHVAITPDGRRSGRSVWAPALTSQPVQTAVADQMGRWAGRVANWTAWLARNEHPPLTDPAEALSHAETAFRQVATQPGKWAVLLRHVPSAAPPERVPVPDDAESDVMLCDGIAASSSRLRAITFGMPERAVWSREVSGLAWEHTARAGALICHMSEIALTMLDRRSSQLHRRKEPGARDASVALADARAAWLKAVDQWRLRTTDTRSRVTAVTAETDDLVLRLGRLVYAHPRWTPQMSRNVGLRELDGLAADTAILAAVHNASDAIAHMADADCKTIAAALATHRIFMPSRIVSPGYAAVALPYIRIPGDRADELVKAYRAVIERSRQVVEALDDLALRTGASSQVLALARQAAALQPDPAPAPGHESGSAHQPGPMVSAFRSMGTTDPGLLLRAHAIDTATRNLLTEARTSARSPVRDAAKDLPDANHPPGEAPSNKHPGRARTTSPTSTAPRRHL